MNTLIVVLKAVVGALLVVMTVVISLQVLSRFALNAAMDWTEEVSRISFGYLTLVGAAVALALGRQLAVDVVTSALKGRKLHALKLSTDVVSIAFWIAVAWFSGPLLERVHQMTTAVTQVPASVPYLAVPIGATLMVVFLSRDAILSARALARPEAGGPPTALEEGAPAESRQGTPI